MQHNGSMIPRVQRVAYGAFWALIATVTLIDGKAAYAQSIDYGSLEAMFGEPVTTSVTGSPQRTSDVPGSLIIVTADEIRRSGARDIPGILRHVPGVSVLQWTNDHADVAVRGYNQSYSSRLLVLVNGREVYADHYGYTAWATLPVELSDIRQIEIVEGPNSALFGFNAAAGVINIVTYDPLYDDVNTGAITGGTQGFVQGSLTSTFKLSDTAGLRISLGGRENEDFSTPQRPIDVGSRRGDERKSINVLAHAQLRHGIDARFEFSHSEAKQSEFSPVYIGFFSRYRVTSLLGQISADTPVGLLQAKAYMNWFKADGSFGASPNDTLYRDNPLYVVQLQDLFKIGSSNTLRLAAEYRHSEVSTLPVNNARVFYDVYAGSAMWQWDITPEVALTNAARVDSLSLGRSGPVPPDLGLTNADWNNRKLTQVSFNSGLVWHPDGQNTFRMTAARGVQLPSIFYLGGFLYSLPGPTYLLGVPTLKPAIVMNYELGWDRKLPSWNTTLHIRAFHQTTSDVIASTGAVPFAPNILATPANIGRSQATGLELSLEGTLARYWRWGLSYTPEVISDHFGPGFTPQMTEVDYQHTNPVHVVNANLGWARGRWEIDGYLRYQSGFDGIQGISVIPTAATLTRISGYASLDARAAYRVTDWFTVALSGQNLLESPQTQTSAADIERRVYVTATANF